MVWYIGSCILAGVLMPFAYSILIAPTLGLLFLIARWKSHEGIGQEHFSEDLSWQLSPWHMKLVVLVTGMVCGVWHCYVLGGWAAFMVASAIMGGVKTGHPLICQLIAFLTSVGVLGFLAEKEGRADLESIGKSFLSTVFTAVAYLVFAIWPTLMSYPYGYFLRWWFPTS